MKNNTIKHIALGLLLAGYASSAAWAFEATTTGKIRGVTPVLKATAAGSDKTIAISSLKASGQPHAAGDYLSVGDKLVLSYVLTDADGDAEGTASNSGESLALYYRADAGAAWTAVPAVNKAVDYGSGSANTITKVSFTIPAGALGAKYFGYKILEKTQFGYPAGDRWYMVPDAFNKTVTDLGTGTTTEPPGPGETTDPETGGNGGDIETPVTPPGECKPGPDELCGVQPPTGNTIKIHLVQDSIVDESVDYAVQADDVLIGNTYTAVVYDKDGAKDTATYAYSWHLAGKNDAAGGTTVLATPVAIADATAQQYKIDVNSKFGTTYAAGAQGFNLQVKAN